MEGRNVTLGRSKDPMTAIPLDFANPAVRFDAVLRYHVPSRTKGHETHLVDLGDYSGNGRCSCPAFTFNFEPILRRIERKDHPHFKHNR